MTLEVVRITKALAQSVVEVKHYSGRLGIFWYGFGLFREKELIGVCVFGQPSVAIQKHAFADRDFQMIELTRLVVDEGVKNGASILISRALKMLPTPSAIVSYADSEYSHVGIVYQATNWLYTGSTVAHDGLYVIDGKKVHSMSLRKDGITKPMEWARQNGIEYIKPKAKHRYFTFVGNKREVKAMRRKLKYPIIDSYPKGPRVLYDSAGRCSEAAGQLVWREV